MNNWSGYVITARLCVFTGALGAVIVHERSNKLILFVVASGNFLN